MKPKTKIALAGASALALAAGGVGVATAAGGGEDGTETPIRGSALQRAGDAAIQHLGGGQVTETEVGDEDSYYEVEVTKPDGSQVDVQLNRGFDVVGEKADDESGTDED